MNRYIQSSREIGRSCVGVNFRPLSNRQIASRFIEAVKPEVFTGAMRNAVAGVNIVTTDGPAGRFGVTVSAFSSVSAEPPQVLACINRKSPVGDAIAHNGVFCVNLLSVRQRHLANVFAGMAGEHEPYDFVAARWNRMATGAPAFEGVVVAFDCVLGSNVAAETHRIFIGRVVAAVARDGQPLLYTGGAYGRPVPLDQIETENGAGQ